MTPKEKIEKILDEEMSCFGYFKKERAKAAEAIIKYFSEATGYDLETLLEKEDEIQ